MTALQLHRLRIGFNGRLEGAQTTMITARIARRVSAARGRLLGGLEGAGGAGSGRRCWRSSISVGGAALAGGLVYMRAVLAMRIPEAHQVNRLIARAARALLTARGRAAGRVGRGPPGQRPN